MFQASALFRDLWIATGKEGCESHEALRELRSLQPLDPSFEFTPGQIRDFNGEDIGASSRPTGGGRRGKERETQGFRVLVARRTKGMNPFVASFSGLV